jgi:hypothetical protein
VEEDITIQFPEHTRAIGCYKVDFKTENVLVVTKSLCYRYINVGCRLPTMNRKQLIQDELHKCNTQLKNLLEAEAQPLTVQPFNFLTHVTLNVKFDVVTRYALVEVKMLRFGIVFLTSYTYARLGTQIICPIYPPIIARVTVITHTDYTKEGTQGSFVDYIQKDPIPDTIMQDIEKVKGEITARNERQQCVIYAFPYFINLDFQFSSETFPFEATVPALPPPPPR